MIFPLSLICAFGLVTACIVICIVNAVPWYFIIGALNKMGVFEK